MSELRTQLLETATTLLTSGADEAAFVEAGFGQLLLSEAEGGFGGDWGDVEAVLRAVGYHRPELDLAGVITAPSGGDPVLDGALACVALIGGALQKALDLSLDHANTRVQFGKPLGKQQAVQQALAVLAQEAAIVAVAAVSAAKARDHCDAAFEIASAKLRANRAAGTGAAIAHQVHGAIGFTAEYPLNRSTRKLIEWRSAFGNDAYWAGQVGAFATALGGAGLWGGVTERADALLGGS